MLMQSETRWSRPPPNRMINSALVAALANAILSVEAETDAISAQLRRVLGGNWRWTRPLADRYLQKFAGQVRPRRREVVSFLREDPGFVEVCHRFGGQLRIRHWITGAQTMRPVAAAQNWPVPRIETVAQLAEWLALTPSDLGWFADLKGLGYKNPQPRLAHYHYRAMTKATGSVRLIEVPKHRLKDLQQQMVIGILNHIPSHNAAHGFVKGRSIQSFAAPHVGRPVVLRMDLENFFPAFPGARVQSFFRTAGYPETVADLLGALATNSVPRGVWRAMRQEGAALDPQQLWHVQELYARPHLPQGAPTSPSLANLCSYRLDCRLSGLATTSGAAYTRYADDLAFSGDERFGHSVNVFATRVAAIAIEEGFHVHHGKTRIMRQSVRQQLAGLVTNQRLNVRRQDFDLLKATLTNCVRHTPATQNREAHPHFRQHLAGRISFLASIHPERGRRLQAIFDRIVWD